MTGPTSQVDRSDGFMCPGSALRPRFEPPNEVTSVEMDDCLALAPQMSIDAPLRYSHQVRGLPEMPAWR